MLDDRRDMPHDRPPRPPFDGAPERTARQDPPRPKRAPLHLPPGSMGDWATL